ncbi:2-dehydropantoate 2-reductase [Anaerolineales bacterium HSG25]|nr:2-dehydropantoate 2-reductase [Anaerolineales bacterium HSG25]
MTTSKQVQIKPETPLKILVFGAGAIGCFVGGTLASAGHQVSLVGRKRLMQKIEFEGLTIQHPNQPIRHCRPATLTTLEGVSEPFDLILLTVKSPSVPALIEQLLQSSLDISQTRLVSLQNGVGSVDYLLAAFGSERIIAATITIPIQVTEPGAILVSKAKGGLGVAETGALGQITGVTATHLAKNLNQAGLVTQLYDDHRAMKWSKLLLNIINNATSAILDQHPADLISNPDMFDLEISALQEGLAVMQAMQLQPVSLPSYPVEWLARLLRVPLPNMARRTILRPFLIGGRGKKMPSLHIDLAAGRDISEVESLNGAIVRAGQEKRIPTPVNQALTQLLGGIVRGELSWDDYKNRPDLLLAAVQDHKRNTG